MHFDSNYFRDEVREGFYVSGMMKRWWVAQMEVLQTIIEICVANDISIYADYGTLLGAVRHGGFIPWDDDLDIVVFRHDLPALVRCLRNELPTDWTLFESTDINYLEPWYRVCNSDVFITSIDKLNRFHGCMYPAGIDIFIIDYMPPTQEEYEVIKFIHDFRGIGYSSEDEREQYIQTVEEMLNIKINRGDPKEIQSSVLSIYHAIAGSYNENDSNVLIKTDGAGYGRLNYKPEWFEHTLWLPFEGMYIPVPGCFNEILSAEYGDYMICHKGGAGHDYPLYKQLEEEFDEKTGSNHNYTPDKDVVMSQSARLYEKKSDRVIFFLPYDSSCWKYMEPAWKAAVSDPSNIVFVLPISYSEKNVLGELQEQIYDPTGYPEYVSITRLDEINIEAYDIDEIYIQQPWDERNLAFSVHPYFYAPHLRSMCKQLIYLPPFKLYELDTKDNVLYKTFENFVSMPGVVYADKTMVQSESIRKLYIEFLSEWMGEDTRDFWSEKICVYDQENPGRFQSVSLKNKKQFIFQVNGSFFLQYGDRAFDKIREAINIMMKSKDKLDCIFVPHETVDQLILTGDDLGRKCEELVEEIKKHPDIIYEKEAEIIEQLDKVDAYYGTAGVLAHRCNMAKIPVMLMAVVD